MTAFHSISPGLTAVTGGERTGKTSLLRRLCGDLPPQPGEAVVADARWLDLSLPARDDSTPEQVWADFKLHSPQWNDDLQQDLVQALKLDGHLGKKLFMLSTGTRRKVALVALLACGATVTCLDQPYAALDRASIQVIREFLDDMASHASRSWVVADYEADPLLAWQQVIALD